LEALELRSLLSLPGLELPASIEAALQSGLVGGGVDPTRVVVRYRDGMAGGLGASLVASEVGVPLVAGLREVRLAPGASVQEVLEAFRSDPDVLYAEPNRFFRALDLPNDPRFGELWALQNTSQTGGKIDADIDAPEAWGVLDSGQDVVVAVIDSGINSNHADLAANIWMNAAEASGRPGVDDDGNGYVDDVRGYDFVNNDADPLDDHGHGTHVAGTIGAVSNNGIGVAGIARDVKLMALKFIGSNGWGSELDAIRALSYAVTMGARVSNNSWGGNFSSQALHDAIAAAQAQGHLFVSSAGNSGVNTDVTPNLPSSIGLDNVISVAATDALDNRASWSNYGVSSVDLAAPGVSILSTSVSGGYALMSGTSMAAPHVAGAAAVLGSRFPGWGANQIKDRLLGSVDRVASMQGQSVSGGRLNLARAVGVPGYEPVVDIVDVAPSPRPGAVDQVTITFSRPVSGFTIDDLRLSLDGGVNLLSSGQWLATDDRMVWWLGGLSAVTAAPGRYDLSLAASGSGIQGDAGEALWNSAVETWSVQPPLTTVGARVIDDADAAWYSYGNWVSDAPGAGYLGTQRLNAAGTGADTATWSFGVAPGQSYRVSATWQGAANLATDSPFTVNNAVSLTRLNVNQAVGAADFGADGALWRVLGTFSSPSGQLIVSLADAAAGLVAADAVRIEPIVASGLASAMPVSVTTAQNVVASGGLAIINPSGRPVVASLIGMPQQGQAVVDADGTFRYTPRLNFTGSDRFVVGVRVGIDVAPVVVSVTVLSTNGAPVLSAIADRVVSESQDVVAVGLTATDPDGDAISFTATGQSLAYVLDQQLGLRFQSSYSQNWGGRNEKWVQSAANQWYFLLPDGELYRWNNQAGANGTLVGNVGASYWASPGLLHDAVAGRPYAALSVSGSTLTIDRDSGFTGAVVVTATATDGRGGSSNRTFTLTVTQGGAATASAQVTAVEGSTASTDRDHPIWSGVPASIGGALVLPSGPGTASGSVRIFSPVARSTGSDGGYVAAIGSWGRRRVRVGGGR
jgi:subtilisin family serine protease